MMLILLEGILNMSTEDIIREYERSAYTYSKVATSDDTSVIIAGLEPYAGNTLQEKIITFLVTEVGV